LRFIFLICMNGSSGGYCLPVFRYG
jgi:hypothetical protein